jgi:hypothetical protein
MSKIAITVLLFIISTSAICKEAWKCDSQGKYTCLANQTCCRNKVSNTGWACYNLEDGVCCSDGLSICPCSFQCNLTAKRCDRKPTLAFLQETKSEQGVELFIEPTISGVTSSVSDFITGFLSGVEVFSNLPNQDKCFVNDEVIVEDLLEIVNLLKGLNTDSDVAAVLSQVLARATDAYSRLKTVSEGCQALAQDLMNVADKLAAHFTNASYINNFTMHTIMNVGLISEKAKSAVAAFTNGNFLQSGQELGALVKFVLLWDFQIQTTAFLVDINNIDPKNAVDFAHGLNRGLTYFYNLPHAGDCKLEDQQISQDVVDIINLIETFKPPYIKNNVQQLITKVNDIIQRIGNEISSCEPVAKEALNVLSELEAHVKATSMRALTFHTVNNYPQISSKFQKGKQAFENNLFNDSGFALGDLIKFALFWNYKN